MRPLLRRVAAITAAAARSATAATATAAAAVVGSPAATAQPAAASASPFALRPAPTTLDDAVDAVRRLRDMNHVDVVRSLLPVLQAEMGAANPVDLYASVAALQRYTSAHRSAKVLPGRAAMSNRALDGPRITTAYHFMRFAAAAYGPSGALFFHLTDPTARATFANVGGFLSAALAGETASFAQFAGIGRDAIVYESPAAQIGVPKHFVAIDEATRSVVLVIRGTMSISDAMTDLVARQMEFADGVVRACARVRARPRSLALSLVELARVCVALGRLGLSAAVDRQGTLAHATIPAA